MKKHTTIIVSMFFLFFSFQSLLYNCTVGVASGRITSDGRALLWKNRDSSGFENYVRYFISNGYNYLGLFSRGVPSSMYGGMNERGFAIMNSVAYDLGKTGGFDNGRLMKRALEECSNIKEFEALLKKVMGKYDLAANFGVIDSEGGAAIFETSSNSYKIYDANKSEKGYILRTNFSFSGGGKVGIKRFKREKEIFEKELKGKKLSVDFLLKKIFRDITDKDGTVFDYKKGYKEGDRRFYYTKDSICRPYSVSSMVFRGVKPTEPEYLSTFYIILGNPLTGSVIPLWVAAGDLPNLIDNYKYSPLNFEQMKIYSYLYPHSKQYTLDVSYLAGESTPNLIGKIYNLEDSILKESEAALNSWRKSFPGKKAIALFQEYISQKLYKNYKKITKELYYYNLSKNIRILPYYKLRKKPISNFIRYKSSIVFLTEDNRLNFLNIYTKKLKRFKIKNHFLNYSFIENGFNGAFYILSKNELFEIDLSIPSKIKKVYELEKFRNFNKYFGKISFLKRIRNNLLVGVPEKHIISSIDLKKKRILKKAGQLNRSGFRDGTSGLSLLSNPSFAYRNYRDELIFIDRTNNSIRSLTQSNVVFSMINNRGGETGWLEEIKLDDPNSMVEFKENLLYVIDKKGLKVIDNGFSYILKKSKTLWGDFSMLPFNTNVFLYNKKTNMLYKLSM